MPVTNSLLAEFGTQPIEFEGAIVLALASPASTTWIEPGDLYIAKRNTGWQLLTCRSYNTEEGYISPVEPAYPYDAWECFLVVDIIDNNT